MEQLKLAIFDMDGLLLDTERWHLCAFREIAENLGYQFDEELFRKGMGSKVHPAPYKLLRGAKPEDAEAIGLVLAEQFEIKSRELWNKGAPVRPGVSQMLEHLFRHGIKCVIASSSEREKVEKLIANSGLEQYFCDMVCGEDVVNGKPDPEVFLLACGRNGATVGEAIVFEDSGHGGAAARAAGIKYVMVSDLAYIAEDILHSANAVVENISDAIPIVEKLFRNL